jgi:translation initiation factor IF-3
MSPAEAMQIAEQRGLDLVEVAPQANPPVTRIMDFGKYKYELAQKEKRSRKHQSQIVVK